MSAIWLFFLFKTGFLNGEMTSLTSVNSRDRKKIQIFMQIRNYDLNYFFGRADKIEHREVSEIIICKARTDLRKIQFQLLYIFCKIFQLILARFQFRS